jgi:hypothetical protein
VSEEEKLNIFMHNMDNNVFICRHIYLQFTSEGIGK